MQRNLSIDLIKILAAIMVVTLHLGLSWGMSGCSYGSFPIPLFGIAIPLFFMVSGYLMAGKSADYKYVARKIFNVVKLTAIICLIYDLFMYIRYEDFVFRFPRCLLQNGEWWHFWYFGSMIIIYSLLPFIQKFLIGNRMPIALSILGVVCVTVWLLNISLGFEHKYVIQTFRLWYFLFYFIVGYYYRSTGIMQPPHWAWVVLFALLFYASDKFIPAGGNEYQYGSPFCMLYAVSFFLFFASLSVNSKIVSTLSAVVLPTYVFHMVVINKITLNYIHPIINNIPIFSEVVFAFELVLTVFVCFAFSLAINRIPKIGVIFKL